MGQVDLGTASCSAIIRGWIYIANKTRLDVIGINCFKIGIS